MRRYLEFRFDVSGLDDEQIGQLALEVSVQAESSENHPSVPHPESEVVEVEEVMAEVVVELAGADVVTLRSGDATVEVRQYHRDFMGDPPFQTEGGLRYQVVARSEAFCRVCGNEIEPHPSGMCDSCEQQDRYDASADLPDGLTASAIEAARIRLAPYLRGYPIPMIDARRLRIANRTASERDRREIRAEDYVLREERGER